MLATNLVFKAYSSPSEWFSNHLVRIRFTCETNTFEVYHGVDFLDSYEGLENAIVGLRAFFNEPSRASLRLSRYEITLFKSIHGTDSITEAIRRAISVSH